MNPKTSPSATNWQKEIYLNGFSGKLPRIPAAWQNLEAMARRKMSASAYAYIAGGAGSESTINANRSCLDQWKIVPRMLTDVSERDIACSLFGTEFPAPVLLGPVGVLDLVHPQADLAVAKAAAGLGLPYVFSNQASFPMETCAAAMGSSPRWFQLYWSKSAELVQSFIRRAEACGCTGLVVTLDTTMLGWRTRDLDLGYLPFLEGKGIAQYTSDPVFQRRLDQPDEVTSVRSVSLRSIIGLLSMVRHYPGQGFWKKLRSGRPVRAVREFINIYSNPATTWKDLDYLRQQTKLPIILKGILHPDDARKAVDAGVSGVIVSNHGGRQVDGAIGAADALPAVRDAIEGRIPILMDSGIRSGADIFKALALGASAVCIGRPYVYGLAVAGEAGVDHVMRNLLAEFELTMGLAGCSRVSQINLDCIRRP